MAAKLPTDLLLYTEEKFTSRNFKGDIENEGTNEDRYEVQTARLFDVNDKRMFSLHLSAWQTSRSQSALARARGHAGKQV
jgi:hypothetical protein